MSDLEALLKMKQDDWLSECKESTRLQAKVEQLEGLLRTETENEDLLSKQHYRKRIEQLEGAIEYFITHEVGDSYLEAALKGDTLAKGDDEA